MSSALTVVDSATAVRASGDHPLIAHLSAYAAAEPAGWCRGAAVAVADSYWGNVNLCAVGPVEDVVPLVVGLRDHDRWMSLPSAAAAELPEGLLREPHEWAFRWTDRLTGTPPDAATWLSPAEDGEVSALLDVAFPDASVTPGSPRARRWAGVRDPDGRLVAIAADATGHPRVGFVASIATHPAHRGRGLGGVLTGWLVDRLVAEHGRAALWVHGGNVPATAVYDRIGMVDLRMTGGALPGATVS